MEWTPENVRRKDFGDTSAHVAGPGRVFLEEHQNGGVRRIADFGCFYGRNIPPLLAVAGANGAVVGIDHPNARPALDRAKQRFTRELHVEFHEATLDHLPFHDGAFTAGLCWRVLHNLKGDGELDAAMAELHRVLAWGAPLLVAVRATTGNAVIPQLRECDDGAGGTRHDLYFSKTACLAVFGRAGFQVFGTIAEITEVGTSDGNPYENVYFTVPLRRIS